MENQPAKRRKKDDDDDDDYVDSDMISRLPDPVLHHILCFLSHKKAVQTSVLSKSWRHLGPTRPIIQLRGTCYRHVRRIDGVCENCFQGNKKVFTSVLKKTFRRYRRQNLFTQELDLEMLFVDSQSISVLEKWIPLFIHPDKPAVTTFRLSFQGRVSFSLPSIVFKAKSLRELHLTWCRMDEVKSIDNLLLDNLQKLSLSNVEISDEALEKLISGCPMVKSLVLSDCEGFKTVNIGNKSRYLNYFVVSCLNEHKNGTSVKIDAPTLQSIRIVRCSNWYHNQHNYFPRVKSLFLSDVKLSTDSFHNFSCNFPSLEEFSLLDCWGFEEIKLSSCSIKRLVIKSGRSTKKVSIDVPNILYFEFSSNYLPTTFSLTTTSKEWKSHLYLKHCVCVREDEILPRFLKLFGLVEALSQSQISLTLSEVLYFMMNPIKWNVNDHPVVMEHLGLSIRELFFNSITDFLNDLLRIFRPRYINAVCEFQEDDKHVTEYLWKTLIHERGKTKHGWEQYLEEVSIEASDEKGKVWHHVRWTCLPEWSKNQKIRFRLKWRD